MGEDDKLHQVRATNVYNAIRDAYVRAFEDRYSFKPPLTDEDSMVFRWAATQLPPDKAPAAIAHYVGMEDEWFVKNTHSTNVFKKNAAKVMASLIGRRPKAAGERKRISTKVFCDYCPVIPEKKFWGNKVTLFCYPEEVETAKRICQQCIDGGRDHERFIYKPSKAERVKIFSLLGVHPDRLR